MNNNDKHSWPEIVLVACLIIVVMTAYIMAVFGIIKL
jgi:hypothetical protein